MKIFFIYFVLFKMCSLHNVHASNKIFRIFYQICYLLKQKKKENKNNINKKTSNKTTDIPSSMPFQARAPKTPKSFSETLLQCKRRRFVFRRCFSFTLNLFHSNFPTLHSFLFHSFSDFLSRNSKWISPRKKKGTKLKARPNTLE